MWCLTVLALLSLEPLQSLQRAVQTTPAVKQSVNVTERILGEPCGVYTSRCAPGLKCVPPKGDPKPLKTLLDGGGRCGNVSSAGQKGGATDTAPTEAPGEAPCRKRLNALLSSLGPLGPLGLRPDQDVYLPNCNRNGFYKRKQCLSSKPRQKGRCWCVDENGTPLNPNSTQRSASEGC